MSQTKQKHAPSVDTQIGGEPCNQILSCWRASKYRGKKSKRLFWHASSKKRTALRACCSQQLPMHLWWWYWETKTIIIMQLITFERCTRKNNHRRKQQIDRYHNLFSNIHACAKEGVAEHANLQSTQRESRNGVGSVTHDSRIVRRFTPPKGVYRWSASGHQEENASQELNVHQV